MNLSQSTLQYFPAILAAHQARIRFVIILLLSIYLLAYAADITWRLIPVPEGSNNTEATSAQSQYNNSTTKLDSGVDISQIQRLNLFGELNKAKASTPAPETITDAPKTRLKLVLNGVVSASEESAGTAIIEYRGKQQTYAIGEKITGTNATLSQVQSDRVIIKNAGRHETLMLVGIDFSKRKPVTTPTQRVSRRTKSRDVEQPEPRTLSDEALETTMALRDKPASFVDFIAVSPAMQNGVLKGYTVKPGKKRDLFESLGLKSGDIVTEINGFVLTEPSQAREAMGELNTAQSIQLTVNRDDDIISLFLELPEQ